MGPLTARIYYATEIEQPRKDFMLQVYPRYAAEYKEFAAIRAAVNDNKPELRPMRQANQHGVIRKPIKKTIFSDGKTYLTIELGEYNGLWYAGYHRATNRSFRSAPCSIVGKKGHQTQEAAEEAVLAFVEAGIKTKIKEGGFSDGELAGVKKILCAIVDTRQQDMFSI